jgi:alanine racemase
MRGKLTISLEAIKQNYHYLSKKIGNVSCAGVVKANAYGLGMAPIAKMLADNGMKDFFVALPEEGIELRHILPNANIYILNGILAGEEKDFIHHNLIPVLNDKSQIALWQNGRPCVVHIDTGLNRLGFNAKDIDAIDGLNINLLMSHLACADTPDNPFNDLQLHRFNEATKKYPHIKKSFSASDGIFIGSEYYFDMVRPGAALYGLNHVPTRINPMQTVIQLSVPILQTRVVDQKGFTGYAATYPVTPGQRLATVSLGYADGFLRRLGSQGHLYYKDIALPVLGRISMDLVTVDISALPESALRAGDWLDVFTPGQTPDQLARKAGTIGYEILTSLGDRFERVYTS